MKIRSAFIAVLFFAILFAVNADVQAQQADRPLKILSKPQPRSGQCTANSGLTSLRVTFDKSEKVTDVVVVRSSNCSEFDQNAITAAKAIKFTAAMKNGELITVEKLLEYKYSRY